MNELVGRICSAFLAGVVMVAVSLPVQAVGGAADADAAAEPAQTGTQQGSALDSARSYLEQAFSSYQQGDAAATEEYLKTATAWLNKAAQSSRTDKARAEARQLADEIDSFKKNIRQTTGEDENSLVRFWHRATSIIKRETDELIHSYVELSNAEQTLKHLLDAKLHLFTAEHDLFVSHDEAAASAELERTLAYLEEAREAASPAIREKVLALSNDIQSLRARMEPGTGSWKKDTLVHSLDEAVKQLETANTLASPATRLRIAVLSADIRTLREDVERENIRIAYDAAMAGLKSIIHEL